MDQQRFNDLMLALSSSSVRPRALLKPRRLAPLCGAVAAALLSTALPRSAHAVTFFTEITSTAFPSPQPCKDPTTGTGEGCYTNWLTISDIDGDGDLDILFANGGGYYTTGVAESSVIYLNDGKAAFRDATPGSFGAATNRLRQVSVGDIDGDGDLDIYQPGGYGVDLDKLWVQTSQGVFENQAATRLPAGLMSRAGSSHFGDLDGDGDLDLVVGDWANASTSGISRLILYTNDGTGKFKRTTSQVEPAYATDDEIFPTTIVTAAAASGQPPVYSGRRPIDLDFADVDGDFDLDILINHRDGQSRIFLNDGHAHFTDGTNFAVTANADSTFTVSANYPPKKGPYAYNQELCDVDGDGDLDLLVDNAGGRSADPKGNLSQIALNDGTGKFVDVTSTAIFGEPPSDDNAVKCVDVNNDGKMDLVVASLQSDSEKLLLNDGTGKFNYVADAFPVGKDPTLGIDIADLNGDGIFDVVTGQGEGDIRLNRIFKGSGASLRDTRPPKFRAIQTPTPVPGTPTVFMLAVTDSATSETGEEVKDVSVAYTTDTGSGKVKGKFIGGDLFRVVIPAVPNGTTLKLTPSATDRVGNTGTAATMTFTVGTIETGSGGRGASEGGMTGSGGTTGVGGITGLGGDTSLGGTLGSGGTESSGGTLASGGTTDEPAETGGVLGSGGATEEPMSSGGMATGSAGEPSYPEETAGAGGEPTTEVMGGMPSTSSGGSSSSSGGTTSTGGTLMASAGEGMEQPVETPRGKDDDGGCTVAAPGVSANSGLFSAFALAFAGLFARRRRSKR